MHLSTETTPSLLLAVFSAHLFHPLAYLTVFLSSVTTLFQMLCKPLARNSWLSHTARVSRWIVIAFDKQMLWEPSLSIHIGSIHSGYEIVLLWFQQHNAVRAGIFTMSYYTERPDMIWVICHKLTATWTPKLNFQLADSSGQTDGATKKYPTTGYSSGESYKAVIPHCISLLSRQGWCVVVAASQRSGASMRHCTDLYDSTPTFSKGLPGLWPGWC